MLLSFFLSGCGQEQSQSQNQQSEQTGEASKEPPKQLTEIENSIEKIILTLKGPAVGVKEEKSGDSQESGSSNQSTKSEGTQSQDSSSESTQSGGTESQSTQSQSQGTQAGQQSKDKGQGKEAGKKSSNPSPWEKISPILFEIHDKWNSFMPIAAKKGANKELLDKFSNSLNNLTSTITSKNEINTLLSANNVYVSIPDFYSLFESKISPEVKKIRYYIRNIILNSNATNWTQADIDLTSLKASWTLFKNATTKEQQEISNKLDFSIYELEKVVKIKSQPLIYIKGKVALSNIEALEKSSEK